MIDAATRNLLHGLMRRERRSLYQYCREVPPWAGPADRYEVERFRTLAGRELELLDQLGRYMQKRHAPLPFVGPYPMEFGGASDAAFHFFKPKVVAEQKRAVALMEAELPLIQDDEARAIVGRLLELKRNHVTEVAGMTTKPHTLV